MVIGWFFIAGAALSLLWAAVALWRPSSERYRADAMILRARAVAQAMAGDRAAAAKSFDLAILAAEHTHEPTQVLSAIAESQFKTGDRAAAAQTLEQAFGHAMSLGLSDRGGALRDVAVARARAGDGTGARQTAALIQSGADRSRALQSVGIAQAETGDINEAQLTLSRMEERYRDEVLHAMAVAQAKSGDGKGARETAATIKYEFFRAMAVGAVAAAQAQAGDGSTAAVTFAQAFQIADATRDPLDKARILGGIAGAQAKSGDRNAAALTLDRALQIARSIRDANERARALDLVKRAESEARGGPEIAQRTTDWEISEEQIKAGDIKGALQTAATMQDERSKAVTLRKIAEAQAMAGDLAGARKTAAMIGGKEDIPFLSFVVAFMSLILVAAINFLRLRVWAKRTLEFAAWAIVIVLGMLLAMYSLASALLGQASLAAGLAIAEISLLIMLLLLRRSADAFESKRARELQRAESEMRRC